MEKPIFRKKQNGPNGIKNGKKIERKTLQYNIEMNLNACWQEELPSDELICRKITDEQIISALKKLSIEKKCYFKETEGKELSHANFLGLLTIRGREYNISTINGMDGSILDKYGLQEDKECYNPDKKYSCNKTIVLKGNFETECSEKGENIDTDILLRVKKVVYNEYEKL